MGQRDESPALQYVTWRPSGLQYSTGCAKRQVALDEFIFLFLSFLLLPEMVQHVVCRPYGWVARLKKKQKTEMPESNHIY